MNTGRTIQILAKFRLILILQLVLAISLSWAQSGRVISTGFEVNRNTMAEDFVAIPVPGPGLLLLYRNDAQQWKIRSYNQALKQLWVSPQGVVNQNASFIMHSQKKDYTHLYFFVKGKTPALYELRVGKSPDDILLSEIRIPGKNQVFNVFPVENGAFIYLKKKRKEGIAFINSRGKYQEVVDISDGVFLNFIPLTAGDKSYHVYTNIKSRNNHKTILLEFDTDGKKLRESQINIPAGIYITRGYLVLQGSDTLMCIGTYSTSQHYSYETGVFSATQLTLNPLNVKLYPFSTFRNAVIVPSQIRKIEKARRKGKDPEITHLMLPHDSLVFFNGEHLLISEVYFPQYSLEQRYNPATRMFETYQVFNGYLYTHAMVCGFGNDGILKWDNSIENNDILSFSLRPLTRIQADEQDIVLMYPSEDNIVYKVINAYNTIEPKDKMSILSEKTPGLIEQTLFSTLDYWYGNNYIIYGLQRRRETGKGRKYEFFIRKIAYR